MTQVEEIIKAWIVTQQALNPMSYATIQRRVLVGAYLGGAAQNALEEVTSLHLSHFVRAEDEINRRQPKSASSYSCVLRQLSEWLNELRLLRAPIHYTPRVLSVSTHLDPMSAEAAAARKEKLPSMSVLEAIGRERDRLTDPYDRVILAIFDIQMATGLRIGEVLTLAMDPLVDIANQGLHLRLPGGPEKGGNWILVPVAERCRELISKAVTTLATLCAEARSSAKFIEENPGRIPWKTIPRCDGTYRLSLGQIITEFKLRPDVEKKKIETVTAVKVAADIPRGQMTISAGDIESGHRKKLIAHPTIFRDGRAVLSMSNSLCVWGHRKGYRHKATRDIQHFLFPRQLRDQDVLTWLGQTCSRLNLLDEGGNRPHLRTHMPRHLHVTALKDGGASDAMLAAIHGRKSPHQNAHYEHSSPWELTERITGLMRSGVLIGPKADAFRALKDSTVQNEFLLAQVPIVHRTAEGMYCTRDLQLNPCPHHLACLRGCRHHLVDPMNPSTKEELIKARDEALKTISSILDHLEARRIPRDIAERNQNILHFKEIVVHTSKALQHIEDALVTGSKAKIRVIPDGIDMSEREGL
ncbi:hypothetical protein [Geothrix limicola]|nr:hypothetical protein [Geothrix limicola]